ncbi:MAG: cbb3-type cytochrome c oxidase subunit I [Desulfurellaceae bacterium]|nr:cbb3-type cytochrome c oxidase subunit I [Desulfurellaceae bacterium]
MSEAGATAAHDAHAEHHELGFIRTYIFSTDHKMIGRQFIFASILMLIVGGLLAMMMRWELAWPETPVPFTSWISEPFMYPADEDSTVGAVEGLSEYVDPYPGANFAKSLGSVGGAHMDPAFYNSVFTMHATIMIFFVVMPFMVGGFGNYLIPLMIGAGDMAFPVLNMLSFWTAVPATIMIVYSFFVEGGAAAGGWTMYATLSADPTLSGVDTGADLWVISLLILGVSSLMGAINYITTVVNMRAPGMTWFRMPLVIWSLFVTAILLLLALPVLTAALGMLLFDRTMGTSFFMPGGGGEPILWQHLFWFFGHPEVYILVLPAMGVTSDILSTFSRKPIFGYKAMAFSMIALAFLSWIVWGHHMFVSGMNPVLGTAFMLTTMVIAVPSAIKTFNWLGTLWGGNIRFTSPMLFALGFVSNFVIGGLSGIYMASTPVDIFIHDTYFIVAHFHYVVAGIIFGMFAALYYWFPKIFGRMMNETLGKVHFALTYIFFNLAFFPMHFLGVGGHMRRIYNPLQYEFLHDLQWWNVFITMSAFCLGLSQLIFFANFIWSLIAGKKADKNPWEANTLEWTAPSPPGHGNFETTPTVYRGPYEYSSPLVKEDWLPQDRKLGPEAVTASH